MSSGISAGAFADISHGVLRVISSRAFSRLYFVVVGFIAVILNALFNINLIVPCGVLAGGFQKFFFIMSPGITYEITCKKLLEKYKKKPR